MAIVKIKKAVHIQEQEVAPQVTTPKTTKKETPKVGTLQQHQTATQQVEATAEQKLVDEAYEINKYLEDHDVKPKLKRLEDIKKIFQDKGKALPQDKNAVFVGTVGRMVFSPGSMNLVVTDKEHMIKVLGFGVFKSIAKVTITDLKKYLSEAEIENFSEKQCGSRTLKLVEKI